jgi:hypothetical protein
MNSELRGKGEKVAMSYFKSPGRTEESHEEYQSGYLVL